MERTYKSSLKIFGTVLLVILISILLTACRRSPIGNNNGGNNNQTREKLDINFAAGNAMRTMTYNTGTPITLPNGKSYTNGDLKPVWEYIGERVNVEINDVTNQGQNARDMIQIAAAQEFKNADIFGGDIAEQLMYNGANNYFINLKDYEDKLPDFFNYLNEMPIIESSITAYDGGIYHIPYIAEENEFSRVFFGRSTWVRLLLDENDVLSDINNETTTLTVHYEGFWKGDKARNNENVISLQNESALLNKLDAKVALDVLKKYIDKNYPDLEKRSDLYLGKNAQYDIDEMVALMRVIKLSPKTLSKEATGRALNDVDIIPFFFRTKNQREEIFHLINYFGGVRTYGSNTFTNKFFIDNNNELQYTFIQDDFLNGLNYLKDFFSEGLIHPDWDDVGGSLNYRTALYGSDKEVDSNGNSTVKQLGFMTYDFIASTGSSSPTGAVEAFLPPLTTLKGEDPNVFYHYIETPRTIMIDGWSIASHVSGDKLDAALRLFNYLFTEEGSFVQNFGVPNVTADFENLWETPKGDLVPTVSDWLIENAEIYGSGDIAEFGRNFIGIRMAVGYKADIGFELQYMVRQATESYLLYLDAGVRTLNYSDTNNYMRLSPPVFSLNRQEQRQLNQIFVGDEQLDMMYRYIKSLSNAPKSVDEIKQSYLKNNIEDFLQVYQNAYRRVR